MGDENKIESAYAIVVQKEDANITIYVSREVYDILKDSPRETELEY